MGEQKDDIRQYLADEKFSDEEVDDILERAGKIQHEADVEKGNVDRADLEAGAAEVGISRDFIEQAIKELRAERAQEATKRKKRRSISIAVGVIAAIIIIASLFSTHKSLNSKFNDVESKQAQLDNVLQRRHDLIPNLISMAKASAAHEENLIDSLSDILQNVEKAKNFEEKQALEQKLGDSAQQLISAMQINPETSSTEIFIRLSDEMAGAENRISVERKRYNEAVANYNQAARGFPVSIFRPIFGFPGNISYFQTSEEAKTVPKF